MRNTAVQVELVRESAAAVIQLVFPRGKKIPYGIPGLHRTGISRARNGCTSNPLYRIALWFLALTPDLAQLVVNWLQDLVTQMRAAPGCVRELSLREQAIEGEETRLQVAYHAGDVGVRRLWIQRLEHERAAIDELLVALRAEEAAATRRIAA